MRLASIAIPAPVHTAFTYSCPDGMEMLPGTRVLTPFGGRKVVGIFLGFVEQLPAGLSPEKVRPIERILDPAPAISAKVIELIEWMSRYYCAPIGEVFRAALPKRLIKVDQPKTTRPTTPREIAPFVEARVELVAEQRDALAKILAESLKDSPTPMLLHGITGSGKTEVYLRVFEEMIASGKQCLLLVPEIGLTPQLTGRVAARFGDRVAVYHSALTDAQRHAQWERTMASEVDVVVGTRSALFAPLSKLAIIVVDEEHDASFKQDEGFLYSARDGAVMRAHLEKIPIVLGSATPSAESFSNATLGKYGYIRLASRPTNSPLPRVELIDIRERARADDGKEKTKGENLKREFVSLTPKLYDAMAHTLARGEQTLLYIGRRGFAGSLQCDACGEVFTCPNCDISLTLHRGRVARRDKSFKAIGKNGSLICHYCDYSVAIPDICCTCSSTHLFTLGCGTERLEAEVQDFFPDARIARLDSDIASSNERRNGILDGMRSGEIDILVGTQMVTKGHDFPKITLVGVVSADSMLGLPDFRASERAFQLLTQVAGRAGRANQPGRVIIQTRRPDHISFVAASDHDSKMFLEREMEERRALGYPPFVKLANIRISSNYKDRVTKIAEKIANMLKCAIDNRPMLKGSVVLGPAPAPIERIKNRYRWQILLKTPTARELSSLMVDVRRFVDSATALGAKVAIDVDPVNML